MKRTVLFALAMALPAMAGSGKESTVKWYYAEPERPLVLELAGVHTWTMADAGDDMHNMNMGGVDATLVYKLDDNWATTLRFGWAEGSGRRAFNSDEVILKRQLTNWAFTGGVRYTAPVSGKLSWFAAANLGLGRTEIKDSWFAGEDGRVQGGRLIILLHSIDRDPGLEQVVDAISMSPGSRVVQCRLPGVIHTTGIGTSRQQLANVFPSPRPRGVH